MLPCAIVCAIIFIIIGHCILQHYSKKAIGETTKELDNLNDLISKEEVEYEEVKESITNIHEKWDKRYITMAFYIEHNELEKVETELTGLRSSIETKEYEQAQNELARAEYILKHIEEKNKLSWKNIF